MTIELDSDETKAPGNRIRQNFILGAVCALVIGIFAWIAKPGFLESSPAEGYYNLLVQGFQSGQLNVKRNPAPGLAQLPNPYDPTANDSFVKNEHYMSFDMSYYKGKLYLYFGITPALVLFWPYATLTNHYLPQKDAVVIFCSLGFLISVSLLYRVWRRYFPRINVWIAASGVIVLGLTTGLLEILPSCNAYEVASSCGFAFAMLALAAIWSAIHNSGRISRWLLLASLAYGLAIGARPSLLFGAIIILLPVAQTWRKQHSWKQVGLLTVAAVVPITLIGVGLALYNYLRFANPFEFGWQYQLTSIQNSAARQFSLHYLWFNFRFYFLQPMRWTVSFPFFESVQLLPLPHGYAGLGTGLYTGILCDYPIAWLALAGPLVWNLQRQAMFLPLRWFAGAIFLLFAICTLTLCLFLTASGRYELDFLPALMLLAVIGIFCLEQALANLPRWRRIARIGWVLLLAYSVTFNVFAGFGSLVEADCFAGNHLLNAGAVEDAIFRFQQALRLDPESAEAHAGLGNALFKKGDINGAMMEFNSALKTKPALVDIHNNLGYCYLQKGQLDDAVIQFQKAVELQPGSAVFHNALGNALFQKNDTHGAIIQYGKALGIEPNFKEAHDNLAYCLLQSGQVHDAIVQYQKAVELQPESSDTHNGLGNAFVQNGMVHDAIVQYQQALQLNPNFPEACYNLGYCYARIGRADDAIIQYRKAIELWPDFTEAYNRLAWILATWPASSVRNGSEAVALAEKANKLSRGNDARVLRVLAAAYAEAGRFQDATSIARKALGLATTQSNAILANQLRRELGLYEAKAPFAR